ncbi:MAG: hypothetical protein ABIP38_05915 [Steroidobacteraceae bacterium]
MFELALLLHASELLVRGHWLVAAVSAVLAGGTHLGLGRLAPGDPRAPRRLLLAADGSVHVHCVGGATVPATVAGESLWLGNSVLLVVRDPARTHRLLLGPGNLDAFTLATLRRRLRGAAAAAVNPAVDSRSAYRTRPGAIEQITRGFPV